METIKFSCKLLTDVIVNQSAATEGPNATLDFIPGSNFLGIAASCLYHNDSDDPERLSSEESWLVFHSGAVRFGDAHPAYCDERTLRIPASFYYPKLGKMTSECYVHHAITERQQDNLVKKQLKQCRAGFYTLGSELVRAIETPVAFAIKSAYDRESRRSKDEQMYGYQSLAKGQEFYFEIEVDDAAICLKERIIAALIGIRRIGRSKTAQYGQVDIVLAKDGFSQPLSTANKVKSGDKECVVVYADSRLVFLDPNGLPTFQPSPEQLGICGDPDAIVLYDKSQIRTFQYAPWNFQRQCFDTDRCGIEKGSVFVVATSVPSPSESAYVGSYRNEGFGRVIYNPAFLQADANACAKLNWYVEDEKNKDVKGQEADKQQELVQLQDLPLKDQPLVKFLVKMQEDEKREKDIYRLVNTWVKDNKSKFKGNQFASQWGTIRSIAMMYRSKDELKSKIEKYLDHGVAKDKWVEKGRILSLLEFFEVIDDSNAQLAIINLAAEMAKACKR